ncbi:hypothetical protein [Clostridium brassicae]|uniref:ATP-binding protein n=1 Tax=Clostridium brassicae TaxID=2999072 RepID=A0ABT4D809_9CLOT|nr:hypothetical protein [Clostridium brassicae]MCY6958421.1 hypothetical protein [Clostridium brassicae]
MCNVKSDIGAKAAWKGFSSQTTYIAYRLMLLNDKYNFYPEKVEDLMVKNGDSIAELVQIKNLSNKLALSSFSPKADDSFFRRALANKKNNESFTLKVVSFGEIGDELQGLINKDEDHISSIKAKLLSYKYSEEDINWIFSKLLIEKVDEADLKKEIYKVLEEKIETMAAPQVAFDTLICYVSDLSRYSKYTSKEEWNKKIDNYVNDIVAIKGMCSQYGRTIINLAEYKTQQSTEELTSEYQLGVNTHPQHIRNNLDIIRDKWLDRIENCFQRNNNVVIIKGASGQGKSSLAYRYLIDNYPENYVFVVEKVVDSQQAIDIVAALNGLSVSKQGNSIVYMDVYPYDKEWLWIAEEISKRGINIKLLITIREEDYNRSDIDFNKIRLEVIDLYFGEAEAREIFTKYNSPYFLNFEQAWEKFGEIGPFMEFMYLLNQSDTLTNKLKAQINRIATNEENADEWLNVLQVICYVSKNNLKINLQRLLSDLTCKQTRKMLQQFENEYLIKISSDNRYVECLHAVRAEILYEILIKNSLMDEEIMLIHSLNSVDEFCQSMLVRYFFNHSNIDEFIDKLDEIKVYSWTSCASLLSGFLWLDTYKFYRKNKESFKQGNKLTSDNFTIFLGDTTGYLEFDYSEIINPLRAINPVRAQKIEELINNLPENKINYHYTDSFINNIKAQLNTLDVLSTDNLSEVGFVLFWLAQRNVFIEDASYKNIVNNLSKYSVDSLLDFLVGVQVQNRMQLYDTIVEYLAPIICNRYSIIRLQDDKTCIEADFIENVFVGNLESNSIGMNERVMTVVGILRRLFFNRESYKVQAIGTEIIEGIKVPDTHKNISSRNLPLVWITQMNGWIIKLDDYEKRTGNWNDFISVVNTDRNSILSFAKMVSDAICYFYKKEGSLEKFLSCEFKEKHRLMEQISTKVYKTPKCANDRYGLTLSKNKVDLPEVLKMYNAGDSEKDITSYVNKYKTSFTNFSNQMVTLVKSRHERGIIDENGRLSLININASVSDLVKMQKKFSELLVQNDGTINIEEEYEQLLLLSVIWDFLYNNEVRKESSLLYDCKQIIKKSRRKMNNFFSKIFGTYTSREINRVGSRIYISLNAELAEKFSEQLYLQFKKEFFDTKVLSIGSLFLEDFADSIIVTIPLTKDTIVGGFKIDLQSLINCQNVEKFLLFRQPLDKSEISAINKNSFDEENVMFNSYRVIGNLSALSLFYNHTTAVIKYLKSLSQDTIIQEKTFYSWQEEGSKFHRQVLQEVVDSLDKLKNIVPDQSYESYLVILTLLNDYKETSDSIVLTEDIESVSDLLNSAIESITEVLESCTL